MRLLIRLVFLLGILIGWTGSASAGCHGGGGFHPLRAFFHHRGEGFVKEKHKEKHKFRVRLFYRRHHAEECGEGGCPPPLYQSAPSCTTGSCPR